MINKFSLEERKIINLLFISGEPLTTFIIAKYLEISWQTAKKYLMKLKQDGYVECERSGKSIHWSLKILTVADMRKDVKISPDDILYSSKNESKDRE